MAEENNGNIEWSSPEPLSEEGRGLPITNTTTPIPEVKPPKQPENSGGGEQKKE